jgi:hypothetical protein
VLPVVPNPGMHTLRVVADSLGGVTEPNEANNAILVPVQVLQPGTLDAPQAALRLALSTPFPNPSHRIVSMALELPAASRVDFDVIDIQGRIVWSQRMAKAPGRWTLSWSGLMRDGSRARPGVYLARVRTAGATFSRRLALIH